MFREMCNEKSSVLNFTRYIWSFLTELVYFNIIKKRNKVEYFYTASGS